MKQIVVVIPTRELLSNSVQHLPWLCENGLRLKQLVEYVFFAWVNVFDNISKTPGHYYTPKEAIADILHSDMPDPRLVALMDIYNYVSMDEDISSEHSNRLSVAETLCNELYWELQPTLESLIATEAVRHFEVVRWLGSDLVVRLSDY